MIDPTTAKKIKDTADIVEVVSDYVHLTRRGANYMGLCPFHNERTPSFSVNKARNFCYCFSCHKGGSPVNFIMEKEGISYYDALKQLARKYGIEVKEREMTDEEKEAQSRKEGMFVANEWAKNYFQENLFNKQEGKEIGLSYIYGRGITDEAIKAFHLGYAIDKGNDFLEAALKKGFSLDVLKSLGLIGTNQQGLNYDKLRGRVIFPVLNSSGKTVAFGGRDLKGGLAKYINSPESEIYSKSKELYGIYQAKGAIVRENKCYLVEGYFDVIGMWQSGIQNVVASSGTALTDGQISMIHRFTENVVLIYDGDAAGIKASLRGIDMLLSHNLNVTAVPLPPGEDPDSMAATHTPEELKKYLSDNETDIIRFKIKILLDEAKNDPQKRWMVVRSIVESLSHISDKIKRDIYIQESSELLSIKESTLSVEVSKARQAIIEQEKQKRRTLEIQKNYPTDKPEVVNRDEPIETTKINQESSLFPLEHNLIITCMKYGFLSLWDSDGNYENDDEIETTLSYIDAELNIDGIKFSHPVYDKAFNLLKDLLPEFKKDLKEYKFRQSIELEDKRKEGYEERSHKSISLQDIQKEEEKLEKNLLDISKKNIDTFCRNYIFDKLGSHEDSSIRQLANEAMLEKHQLSNLFSKTIKSDNSEEEIIHIIISSLNLLKNGIIDLNLSTLMEELGNISINETEKVRELHEKIGQILQVRSRMAKDIGERILYPGTRKSKSNKRIF